MFDTDNIGFVEFKLLYGEIDIILRALELYAYTFNYITPVNKDEDIEDLRSSLIYHTYHQILIKYSKNKNFEKGISAIDNIRNNHEQKVKRNYYNTKKYKKVA